MGKNLLPGINTIVEENTIGVRIGNSEHGLRPFKELGSLLKATRYNSIGIFFYASYEGEGQIHSRYWRFANEEEIAAYNNGIKNINDISSQALNVNPDYLEPISN